ncbi:MAG TPA: FAD-dependent oxidoreductase [Actinophytocola sp.]|uniref:FAD-dependent oxidoreductase n=1 Tax=Actinophytocola sp. TaxID=1872138 RepID=UPI002DBEEEA5|nr:FAD-dependent oxidoreductase [Actinophytocola sp.]HEU5474021.1 FAD-dependent oxidoreductase [Actinophytocola sp.]
MKPLSEQGELPETPDLQGAFPRLSEDQIDTLAAHGERRTTRPDEVLFSEGERCDEFFVILSGKVATVQGFGQDARIIRVHGAGRFVGELGLLQGQTAFSSAVVVEPGEVLAVPVEWLRAVVEREPTLGDVIVRACLIRRSLLIGLGAGFRIVGSCYSPDTKRLREFAARNRLPHRWIDPERDKQAETLLRRFGIRPEDTPVVIWKGEQLLRNPSNAELARMIGLPAAAAAPGSCDLLVVGAGPAGLAAAVYAASEGLTTIVVDAVATGGQAGTSPRIENYLGFPSGISGAELAERAVIQAGKFGARTTVAVTATTLSCRDSHYLLTLDDGTQLTAPTVVIATGARYRKLAVRRLDLFEGTCVYYAATQVEAAQCRLDPVAVVGGGNSAGQAAVFLAETVPKVYLLSRSELTKSMSRYLIDNVERHPRIEVLEHHEVRELLGDTTLDGIVVEHNATGARRNLDARAMFVFIGAEPGTAWLTGTLELDRHGFVRTGFDVDVSANPDAWAKAERRPLTLESSQPGVFAVGDVRSGSIKRVASAVGEGAMAIRLVHEHLEQSGNRTPINR